MQFAKTNSQTLQRNFFVESICMAKCMLTTLLCVKAELQGPIYLGHCALELNNKVQGSKITAQKLSCRAWHILQKLFIINLFFDLANA